MESCIKLAFCILLIPYYPIQSKPVKFGLKCIVHKTHSSEDDFYTLTRLGENSKYILINSASLQPSSSEDICDSWNLKMAQVRDPSDLISIRNNLQTFDEDVDPTSTYWISGNKNPKGQWVYGQEERGDGTEPFAYQAFWGFSPLDFPTQKNRPTTDRVQLHWVKDTLTKKSSLVMMDVEEPNNLYENQNVICQYPPGSHCFQESDEEKNKRQVGMKANKNLNLLGKLNAHKFLIIGVVQRTLQEATSFCQSRNMTILNLELNSEMEVVRLIGLIAGWVEKQDLPGAATGFWVGGTDVFLPMTAAGSMIEWVDNIIRDPETDRVLKYKNAMRQGEINSPGTCLAIGVLIKAEQLLWLQRVPCDFPQWVICERDVKDIKKNDSKPVKGKKKKQRKKHKKPQKIKPTTSHTKAPDDNLAAKGKNRSPTTAQPWTPDSTTYVTTTTTATPPNGNAAAVTKPEITERVPLIRNPYKTAPPPKQVATNKAVPKPKSDEYYVNKLLDSVEENVADIDYVEDGAVEAVADEELNAVEEEFESLEEEAENYVADEELESLEDIGSSLKAAYEDEAVKEVAEEELDSLEKIETDVLKSLEDEAVKEVAEEEFYSLEKEAESLEVQAVEDALYDEATSLEHEAEESVADGEIKTLTDAANSILGQAVDDVAEGKIKDLKNKGRSFVKASFKDHAESEEMSLEEEAVQKVAEGEINGLEKEAESILEEAVKDVVESEEKALEDEAVKNVAEGELKTLKDTASSLMNAAIADVAEEAERSLEDEAVKEVADEKLSSLEKKIIRLKEEIERVKGQKVTSVATTVVPSLEGSATENKMEMVDTSQSPIQLNDQIATATDTANAVPRMPDSETTIRVELLQLPPQLQEGENKTLKNEAEDKAINDAIGDAADKNVAALYKEAGSLEDKAVEDVASEELGHLISLADEQLKSVEEGAISDVAEDKIKSLKGEVESLENEAATEVADKEDQAVENEAVSEVAEDKLKLLKEELKSLEDDGVKTVADNELNSLEKEIVKLEEELAQLKAQEVASDTTTVAPLQRNDQGVNSRITAAVAGTVTPNNGELFHDPLPTRHSIRIHEPDAEADKIPEPSKILLPFANVFSQNPKLVESLWPNDTVLPSGDTTHIPGEAVDEDSIFAPVGGHIIERPTLTIKNPSMSESGEKRDKVPQQVQPQAEVDVQGPKHIAEEEVLVRNENGNEDVDGVHFHVFIHKPNSTKVAHPFNIVGHPAEAPSGPGDYVWELSHEDEKVSKFIESEANGRGTRLSEDVGENANAEVDTRSISNSNRETNHTIPNKIILSPAGKDLPSSGESVVVGYHPHGDNQSVIEADGKSKNVKHPGINMSQTGKDLSGSGESVAVGYHQQEDNPSLIDGDRKARNVKHPRINLSHTGKDLSSSGESVGGYHRDGKHPLKIKQ